MALEPNNVPSNDPANDDSLTGLIRLAFGKLMQGTDGMLPARVVAFNNNRNRPRVTVQPLVSIITTGGQRVRRAQIASLPVFQFGAGGYMLSFPITTGSLGWILASDRDISVFLQSYKESQPQTFRKKNFADAVFIPDMMNDYAIDAEDADNPVFQSADGSVRLALWPEFAKITAPRGLGINAQPGPNVILQADSTEKAAIPWPRMTEAQRDAIPSPVEGMVVWNLDTHGPSYYNGSIWS